MREKNLKLYLLGLLSESEQTQLELELLSNDEAYEQLLVAEDDLIEAYLQGELTAHEKRQFERVFLAHPKRQQQLQFVQTLRDYAIDRSKSETMKVVQVSTTKSKVSFWQGMGWKLATASVVLVAGFIGVWLWRQQSATPALTSPTPLANATPITTGTETASVQLSPGQTMAVGEEITEIPLTAKVGQVRLQLWLGKDQYNAYKATLQTYDPPAQKELPGEFKPQPSKENLKFIEVLIPAADLQGQIFALRVDGVTASGVRERADTFRFKVKRE